MFSKIAPKVTIYFGCFCTRIWHQDLPKIVQSGHAAAGIPKLRLLYDLKRKYKQADPTNAVNGLKYFT